MSSAAYKRGPLIDLVIPRPATRPLATQPNRTVSVAFVGVGATLAALAFWLTAATFTGGFPSVAGLSVGPHMLAGDVLMAASFAYLLAVASRLGAHRAARDLTLIAAGTLLLALCAQLVIHLPFTPVPVTGQTFGVLLVAAALGWERGLMSVLAYVGLGAAGLPVFADVSSPASYGYLIGFALAALVVGWLAERGLDRHLGTSILAMLAGEVAIYLGGLPWLAHFVGWNNVVALGFVPFIPGDAAKLAAAARLLPAAWSLTGRARLRSEDV